MVINVDETALREVFPTNPLKEVAFEVRFPVNLRVLRDVYLIQQSLGTEYPQFRREVLSLPDNSSTVSYIFFNPTKGRIVRTGEDRFAVIFTRYKDFGEFRTEVKERVQQFCDLFEIKSLTRMGLRYINNIYVHGNGQPPDFTRFIQPYANFDRTGPGKVEQFGIEVLMQKPDCLLNARSEFALHPPAHSGICVLDFDAFTQGEPALDRMDEFLDRSHHYIQVEFLTHITDEYKEEMRKRK